MASMHIVDRRLNPSGKNLANRQRFMRRAKVADPQGGARELRPAAASRMPTKAARSSLPAQGVHEPSFRRSRSGGIRDHLLPGNKEYIEGDTIPRPQGGGGGGGSEGSPDGEGEDDFRFALSRDEFVDLFLEDLELPDLAKRRVVNAEAVTWHRAGYSVTGSPANLALNRTVRNSLSRRIALRRPKTERAGGAARGDRRARAPTGRTGAAARAGGGADSASSAAPALIPYIDPLDVRYRRFEAQPKPVAQAVMFCLMDVSGSMTEHMKDLAKRFYVLLYIFLKRRYKNVDVVFIRHTHQAQEVDEDTFFNSPETGGTVVSTALEEMQRVIEERYSPDNWNIYAAQASDGDNTASRQRQDRGAADRCDPAGLPVLRLSGSRPRFRAFPARLHPPGQRSVADLHRRSAAAGAPMAMRKVGHRRDIYPVFRELFARKTAQEQETV